MGALASGLNPRRGKDQALWRPSLHTHIAQFCCAMHFLCLSLLSLHKVPLFSLISFTILASKPQGLLLICVISQLYNLVPILCIPTWSSNSMYSCSHLTPNLSYLEHGCWNQCMSCATKSLSLAVCFNEVWLLPPMHNLCNQVSHWLFCLLAVCFNEFWLLSQCTPHSTKSLIRSLFACCVLQWTLAAAMGDHLLRPSLPFTNWYEHFSLW